MNKIKITKRENIIRLVEMWSRWRHVYSSKKGDIRLAEFITPEHFWKIYCLEGELFEGVEYFKTKKEAEKRIKELLK
jgi:hypothetical protein